MRLLSAEQPKLHAHPALARPPHDAREKHRLLPWESEADEDGHTKGRAERGLDERPAERDVPRYSWGFLPRIPRRNLHLHADGDARKATLLTSMRHHPLCTTHRSRRFREETTPRPSVRCFKSH